MRVFADYLLYGADISLFAQRVGDLHLPESQIICDYLEQVHPEPSLLPESAEAQTIVHTSRHMGKFLAQGHIAVNCVAPGFSRRN